MTGAFERSDMVRGSRWAALAVILFMTTGAVAAEQVSIDAAIRDDGVAVHATATVKAPFDVIWRTLTDYDHLANFIPGMERSHVIGRHGTAAIVQQTGEAGVSFLRYPINVIVESDEHPPSTITVRVLSGNLRRLDGAYSLVPVPGRRDEFVLGWTGLIDPDMPIPGFIMAEVLKDNISDQFLGMVREIERKARPQVANFVE